MKISPRDAWIIARLLGGRVPGSPGSAEPVLETPRVEPLADRLRETEVHHRVATWKGFLTGRADRDDWAGPVGEADPAAPPPPEEASAGIRPRATLADLKRLVADTSWPWPGWLAGGVLNTVAADPGVGKTILAMNLARILWNGWPWPDGQTNPFSVGTRTLWLPGDRHFTQLIELADAYGLPGDAMMFNANAEDPTGGLELDDPETLDDLEEGIRESRPGLVIVDTVGMTTQRNLGRPEDAKAYFGPLMEIASASRVSFLLVTHLSKESQALGRRIVGAARVVWKLTRPDPEGQPDRRRLWVDKSYGLIPKPLGMTIAADGCTFDDQPPDSEGEKKGRPPKRQEDCKQWLLERLADGPVPVKEVRKEVAERDITYTVFYKVLKSLDITQVKHNGRECFALPTDADDEEEEAVQASWL